MSTPAQPLPTWLTVLGLLLATVGCGGGNPPPGPTASAPNATVPAAAVPNAAEPTAAVPNAAPQRIALATRRLAILATPEVAADGIPDLLTAELSAEPGLELVEREQLASVLGELQLAAVGGASRDEQLRLGALLKADLLVMLSRTADQTIHLTISDCHYGARLVSAAIENSPEAPLQTVPRLAALVRDSRQRLGDGLRAIVGISPLISKNLAHDYDYLQRRYAELLENALAAQPGVAVLETAEASSISRETKLGGEGVTAQPLPVWVEGDFIMPRDDDGGVTVTLHLTLLNAGGKAGELSFDKVKLADVPRLLAERVAPEVLKVALVSGARTLSTEAQVAGALLRAQQFAVVGAWDQSLALSEVAVLLAPDRPEARESLLQSSYQAAQLRANRRLRTPPRTSALWMESGQQEVAASLDRLEQLEFLIGNEKVEPTKAIQLFGRYCGGINAFGPAGALPPAEREIAAAALQTLVEARNRLLFDVFPPVFKRPVAAGRAIGPQGTKDPALEQMQNQWHNAFVTELLKRPDRNWQDKSDLDRIARGLTEIVPDGLPPHHGVKIGVLRFQRPTGQPQARKFLAPDGRVVVATVQPDQALRFRFSDAEYVDFLRQLRESEHPLAEYYGRYGLVEWQNKHLDEKDRSGAEQLLEEAEELVECYAALPRSAGDWHTFDHAEKNALADLKHAVEVAVSKLGPPGPRRELVSQRPAKPYVPDPIWAKANAALPKIEVEPIAWEVRRLSGDVQKFDQRVYHADQAKPPTGLVSAGPGLDVFWSRWGVMLLRTAGPLEEMLDDPEGTIDDVRWDGQSLWVASHRDGLSIYDTSGRKERELTTADGLPPFDLALMLSPLSHGRVIAVGSFGEHRRGWCATVDLAAKPIVRVIHEGTKVVTTGLVPGARPGIGLDSVFTPTAVFEYKNFDDPPRKLICIAREPITVNIKQTFLAVDAANLKVDVLNDPAAHGILPRSFAKVGDRLLNAAEVADMVDGAGLHHPVSSFRTQGVLLKHEGLFHIPSRAYWQRIDARTGQSLNGRLAAPAVYANYGVSAHYGLMAWGPGAWRLKVPREPFEDIDLEAPLPPARAAQWPQRYELDKDARQKLWARIQKLAGKTPPLGRPRLRVYPEGGVSHVDGWYPMFSGRLWLDPPQERRGERYTFVDGRLAQVDKLQEGQTSLRILRNKQGWPILAIVYGNQRSQVQEPFKPICYRFLEYDKQGWVNRMTEFGAEGNLNLVRLLNSSDGYQTGWVAHYGPQGDLGSVDDYRQKPAVTIRGTAKQQQRTVIKPWRDSILQLNQYGLKCIYPIPEIDDALTAASAAPSGAGPADALPAE